MPYMICRSQSPEGAAGDRLENEGEVLQRLPPESQTVQRTKHERRVPDPGIAIVPVAGPARRFGQRGGRRRHDRAGGRVAQTLQGQGAALDVAAPRDDRERCPSTATPASRRRCRRLGLRPRPPRSGGSPPQDRATKARLALARGWNGRSSGPRRCPAADSTSTVSAGSPAGGWTVMLP